MPLYASFPLDSFADVPSLQANGTQTTGNASPAGVAGRLEIVADPLGQRGNVLRATLYETDAITAGYQRSEIAFSPDTIGEWWHSWWFMLDESWTDFDAPFIVQQIHDTPDGGDGNKAPNFLTNILSGHLRVIVPEQALPTEGGNLRRGGCIGVQNQRWYHCCLHVIWSTTGTGLRELFVDGVPIHRENSIPTHYVDVVGPYLKLGVYDGLSATAGWVQRRAYFSGLRMWSGPATYQDGMAREPALPRRVTLL